jgi:glycosyl transferase family 4
VIGPYSKLPPSISSEQHPTAPINISPSTMSKKNIIFFHPDLGIGGAERLVIDAAVGLQNLGHKVTIFTSHCDPSHCFEEARDGKSKKEAPLPTPYTHYFLSPVQKTSRSYAWLKDAAELSFVLNSKEPLTYAFAETRSYRRVSWDDSRFFVRLRARCI